MTKPEIFKWIWQASQTPKQTPYYGGSKGSMEKGLKHCQYTTYTWVNDQVSGKGKYSGDSSFETCWVMASQSICGLVRRRVFHADLGQSEAGHWAGKEQCVVGAGPQ